MLFNKIITLINTMSNLSMQNKSLSEQEEESYESEESKREYGLNAFKQKSSEIKYT